ncbi:MAG: amidohydrolase [Candidatus Cloacimonetes bacterium]|jgi:predicted amidohydrolase YtcJ|nr:amidohydrolase [Candidatus Cloacimonadota bacterium]
MKIYHNAKWWIKGRIDPEIIAVGVKDGKIVELFNKLPQGSHRSIDLGGRFVFPGFIDTHTHSFEGGLYSMMIDLSPAQSISDVLELIHEYSRSKGKYIFAWNFDESSIKEKRFPTRQELDKVLQDRNLVLRRIDGHSCIVNSFALKNIRESGKLHESQDEVLRGYDNDLAVHWFHKSLDQDIIIEAYHTASRIALQGGFTGIHTMIGDADMSITHYELIRDRLSDFAVRYHIYPQSFDIDAALDAGATRVGGCILADGSIGSKTAALSFNYLNSDSSGSLYQTDDFWKAFITRAHQNNLQVGVHCIGDRAIKQINDVYLALERADSRDLRHQIIHCEITPDSLLDEIAESKAATVMQPAFDRLWGGTDGFYAGMLGKDKTFEMNRFASLLKRGVKVTGSSDWYITELDIVKSLQSLLIHTIPDERISLKDAVAIYTENAAWLSHDEGRLGKIEKGFIADFSVLESLPSVKISDTKQQVKAIIRDGEMVHDAL